MYGYVRPDRGLLPGRQYQQYRAAYCGLCEALRRRYGFAARFAVNYDFTFLAMVLSRGGCTQWRRCPAHPFRRRPCVCGNEAMDAAADYTVLLAWWKLQDDIRDDGFFRSIPAQIGQLFLRRAFRKAARARSAFSENTRRCLEELSRLEQEKSGSLDQCADCFARILSFAAEDAPDPGEQRIQREIFYHVGRSVYILDAADDLEKDVRHDNYNPLIFRFRKNDGILTEEEKEQIRSTVLLSQRNAASALSLRPPDVWQPILENIITAGIPGVLRLVLSGLWRKQRKEERYPDILIQEESNR